MGGIFGSGGKMFVKRSLRNKVLLDWVHLVIRIALCQGWVVGCVMDYVTRTWHKRCRVRVDVGMTRIPTRDMCRTCFVPCRTWLAIKNII